MEKVNSEPNNCKEDNGKPPHCPPQVLTCGMNMEGPLKNARVFIRQHDIISCNYFYIVYHCINVITYSWKNQFFLSHCVLMALTKVAILEFSHNIWVANETQWWGFDTVFGDVFIHFATVHRWTVRTSIYCALQHHHIVKRHFVQYFSHQTQYLIIKFI